MKIRKITLEDLDKIEYLANLIYPIEYYETTDSFWSKIESHPNGCFLAEDKNLICGYIVSFPFILNEIFNLNCHYVKVDNPSCYYVHDLCVHPDFRGFGLAKSLFDKVCNNVNLPICLVSVLKSEGFWCKLGFTPEKKITYNNMPATYMVKEV